MVAGRGGGVNEAALDVGGEVAGAGGAQDAACAAVVGPAGEHEHE